MKNQNTNRKPRKKNVPKSERSRESKSSGNLADQDWAFKSTIEAEDDENGKQNYLRWNSPDPQESNTQLSP